MTLEFSRNNTPNLFHKRQARKLNNLIMRLLVWACGVLASLTPIVSATALTYKLDANEKACFFSSVEHSGAKIAFYFAVSAYTWIDTVHERY